MFSGPAEGKRTSVQSKFVTVGQRGSSENSSQIGRQFSMSAIRSSNGVFVLQQTSSKLGKPLPLASIAAISSGKLQTQLVQSSGSVKLSGSQVGLHMGDSGHLVQFMQPGQ